MIRDQLCRKCVCSKCSHTWITKTYEIPVRCAKCNSVKWNDDWHATEMPISEPERLEPVKVKTDDALAAFIAKAQAAKGITQTIAVEPEPVNEWIGWTPEAQTYDDQTGEMRTYRKHIKSGKVRWIDSEVYY